jgi:hypothetical protein
MAAPTEAQVLAALREASSQATAATSRAPLTLADALARSARGSARPTVIEVVLEPPAQGLGAPGSGVGGEAATYAHADRVLPPQQHQHQQQQHQQQQQNQQQQNQQQHNNHQPLDLAAAAYAEPCACSQPNGGTERAAGGSGGARTVVALVGLEEEGSGGRWSSSRRAEWRAAVRAAFDGDGSGSGGEAGGKAARVMSVRLGGWQLPAPAAHETGAPPPWPPPRQLESPQQQQPPPLTPWLAVTMLQHFAYHGRLLPALRALRSEVKRRSRGERGLEESAAKQSKRDVKRKRVQSV